MTGTTAIALSWSPPRVPRTTVVAALDYRQLAGQGGRDLSLLFVTHRAEILRQSVATYHSVPRNGAFGEIHGDGRIARDRHVFAMVQSLRGERLGHMVFNRRTRSRPDQGRSRGSEPAQSFGDSRACRAGRLRCA